MCPVPDCSNTIIYGHTSTAMNDMGISLPGPLSLPLVGCGRHVNDESVRKIVHVLHGFRRRPYDDKRQLSGDHCMVPLAAK